MDTHLLRTQWHRHHIPLLLCIVVLIISSAGDVLTQLLRFDREAIGEQWQWWRYLSANITHLGWSHTALNLAGLALIWGLLWDVFTNKHWWLICLVSGLGVTLGLYQLNPELHWYVGLSGLLHGLFVAGVIGNLRRGEKRDMILLAAIVGKLIWEQFSGPMPGSADMAGGPVIVDSHLYGAIAGGFIAFAIKPRAWCHN